MMEQVHVGFWINYSRNAALGATITVPSKWGGDLVSALATLVTISGACTWNMVAFWMHQYRSRTTPMDGPDTLFQIILRNPNSALGSAWDLLKTGNAWQGKVESSRLRAGTLLLVPLVIYVAFTVAAVCVGQVITLPAYEAAHVLLKPNDCGLVNYNMTTPRGQSARNAKFLSESRAARSYATKCYGRNSTEAGCSIFQVRGLPYTVKDGAPCPFGGDGICRTGDHGAYQMETCLLDSHVHLGINAPAQDRVTFRHSVTCAPLQLEQYIDVTKDNSTTNSSLIQFFVGPFVSNESFKYSTHNELGSLSYQISGMFADAGDASDVWTPVDSLNRTDAQVSLYFFTPNSVAYLEPVLDPFFLANGTFNYTIASSPFGDRVLFSPNHDVSAMGCADDWQFCNPSTNDCTKRGSLIQNTATGIGLNSKQVLTAKRIGIAFAQSATFSSVTGLNSAALAATDKVFDSVSGGLPDNQWQQETKLWFETSLAKIQQYIVDYPANKLADLTPGFTFTSFALDHQCSSQIVQTTGAYQNFSFLGISIILVICPIIIMTSFSLETFVQRVFPNRKPEGSKRHKTTAYIAHGILQLTRMALEGAGYDGFAKDMNEVPVTTGGNTQFEAPMEDGEAVCFRPPGYTALPMSHSEERPILRSPLLHNGANDNQDSRAWEYAAASNV